jgi:small subunit ribosomal protein S8
MAVHDTIGDFLTMIRNASQAKKPGFSTQFSNLRLGIVKILKEEGYIAGFKEATDENGHKIILVSLKYVDQTPAITGIERYSKPGRRLYFKSTTIPRVLDNLGISILTTSKGILKDRDARTQKVGGELICKVW